MIDASRAAFNVIAVRPPAVDATDRSPAVVVNAPSVIACAADSVAVAPVEPASIRSVLAAEAMSAGGFYYGEVKPESVLEALERGVKAGAFTLKGR